MGRELAGGVLDGERAAERRMGEILGEDRRHELVALLTDSRSALRDALSAEREVTD